MGKKYYLTIEEAVDSKHSFFIQWFNEDGSSRHWDRNVPGNVCLEELYYLSESPLDRTNIDAYIKELRKTNA